MIATGTRVIVKKIQPAMTTEGGIILRSPQENPFVQAVAVGPRTTADIQPGDQLAIDWNRCGRFEYLEQEYLIIDESNVLAIVDPT
jgi:co-chaperonin GroES (HSP10)